MLKLSYEEAIARLANRLQQVGVDPGDAPLAAELVLEGEVKKGFGLFMISFAIQQLERKRPDQPRVVYETPVSALIHGGNHFGEVAGPFAMRVSLEKAQTHGLAVAAMTDFHPFPLLCSISERVAREGFLCFVFCNGPSVAVPVNGVQRSLGTNPMAISLPTSPRPFTIDMATTKTTLTEVRKAAEENQPLREGIAVDAHGQPTRDARAALEGALTVFGEHKGSALSIMIALLAGSVLGRPGSFTSNVRRGMLMILFRPDLLWPQGDLSTQVQEALQVFRQRGNPGFSLPGERSAAKMEKALRHGLVIPEQYSSVFV